MKNLLLTLLTALLPLCAMAQKEQDFSSRFMSLYGNDCEITCTTVSPLMMERMMQLPEVEENEQMRQVLSQLKSIRLLASASETDTPRLFASAKELAQSNPGRYKPYAETDNKCLYTRRRGKTIVEVVLFMTQSSRFTLINLTGNMDERFLEKVMNI